MMRGVVYACERRANCCGARRGVLRARRAAWCLSGARLAVVRGVQCWCKACRVCYSVRLCYGVPRVYDARRAVCVCARRAVVWQWCEACYRVKGASVR